MVKGVKNLSPVILMVDPLFISIKSEMLNIWSDIVNYLRVKYLLSENYLYTSLLHLLFVINALELLSEFKLCLNYDRAEDQMKKVKIN